MQGSYPVLILLCCSSYSLAFQYNKQDAVTTKTKGYDGLSGGGRRGR